MKLSLPFIILLLLAILPPSLFAQSQRFDFGRFSFALSPKVLKDGSITDLSFGYAYAEKYAGTLRLRFSSEAKNEQFDETLPDSLNASDESGIEAFLIPFEYFFAKNARMEFFAGAGVYYGYHALAEKGYFAMPALEALGKEKVNSFSNDTAMHVAGPDMELGFTYRAGWLNMSAHGGLVPVFYLGAAQKMGIAPLMEPNHAGHSQQTAGSPYVYADISFILFKYVSLAFLYDFSRLNYAVVDFGYDGGDFVWRYPDRTVISQSLKLEASLLIPLQGSVYAQIGYGHAFDSLRLDSASPLESSRQYLILSARAMR